MHFSVTVSLSLIAFATLGVKGKVEPPDSKVSKDPLDSCNAKDGTCSKKAVCINQDRCCDVWASVGECKRKTKFMDTNCPKSCKVCTHGDNNTDCHDLFPKCAEWSQKDECTKNLAWMEENCPKSCEVCKRTPEELREICGARLTNECKNHFDDCGKWAKEGECKSNSWWMEQNCPVACGVCKE